VTARVALVAGLLLSGCFLWPVTPAHAGCEWVRVVQVFNGQIRVHFEERCESSSSGAVETSSALGPPRDSGWDPICVRTAIIVDLNPAEFCDTAPAGTAAAVVPPTVTPGLVARAFRTIDLPPSKLQIQPPHGRTLVNFDTNFYTEQPAFDRTVRLLGRQVELHIWPSQFRWVFGDGAELPSTSAGAPYPDLLITHSYLQKGGVSPRVDTTYAASFRVDGGAWRNVDGAVTIPGSPVRLEVITARPVLVGEN
jgi:hypothetical protein